MPHERPDGRPVPLPAGSLVIGDLHLSPLGGRDVDELVAFADGLEGVPRLVVLGDLFDAWVGDDQVRLAGAPPVLDALKRLTWRGTAVEVLRGNRDFLLGAEFAAWTGARVHQGELVGESPSGERVLVVHGDELCTLDRSYQRLKWALRSTPLGKGLAALPLALRRRVAAGVRGASRRSVPRKPAPEKAMQEEACRALARRHDAAVIVCGHAHAYRDEELEGGPRWVVIDAFGGARDCVRVAQDGGLEVARSVSALARGAR